MKKQIVLSLPCSIYKTYVEVGLTLPKYMLEIYTLNFRRFRK